jgi:hypothetical protein
MGGVRLACRYVMCTVGALQKLVNGRYGNARQLVGISCERRMEGREK